MRSLTPLPPLRRLTRSSRLRAAGSGEDLETALNRSFSGTSEKSTGDAELATLELLHGLILRPNPSAPNVTVSYSMDDVLGGDGEMVNEFQDSGGNEFTVVLTNVDAPQVRLSGAPFLRFSPPALKTPSERATRRSESSPS